MSKDEIYKEIVRYQYISFDMYDTLVKRDLKDPKDIFKLIEKAALKKYKNIVQGYSQLRVETEEKIRKSKKTEVTLTEIYNELAKLYTPSIADELMHLELEYEYNLTVMNPWIKSIYKYCCENGKQIIIITDIYLPEKFIKRVLKKVGIDSWRCLFVSSTSGKTKNDGSLYDLALKELQINGCEILHIGDNKHSDYDMAHDRGIEAIHIEKDRFQLIYNTYMHSDSEMSVLCNHTIAFQNNHMKEEWSRPYKLGYESFGPLLFGFSKWLKENVVKEKIDKIFFLSRDGKIMKRAFDIYDSDHETDSNYFLASRRALQVPKLVEEKNIKDILGFIYFPSELTIESLLRKLGIDDDNIVDSVCKKIEKRKDTIIAKKDLDGILGNKIWNEAVYYIKKNAENERKSFIGYLNQEQFSGRVAIVDIGWFGNMQSNIESIIKQDQIPANVYGYYVALAPDGKHQKHLNMKGYLYDIHHNQKSHKKETLINQVFETIFMADHGSAKRYIEQEGKYSVELLEPDLNDTESINWLNEYQKGALAFVEDYCENGISYDLPIEFITNCAFKQFLRPCVQDAKKWGSFKFRDGEISFIAYAHNLKYYLKNPHQFLKDYKVALWRIGFLKQVFKVNLPYDKIVSLQKHI
nr:HAD family hydrolase [uncultured Blautia sp.]